jgi:hypothetical protein
VKSLFLLLFLVIISFSKSFSQWSTDPNNNLVIGVGWDPQICSDSAGGCYITYNYGTLSYPQKLAVERLDKYGYKPWGDKKQILGELPEQWQAEIKDDGKGGVIISYDDNEVIWPNYNTRVRVQRVDSSGNFLWGETGVRVTTEETSHGSGRLVGDGDGGCVIVWQDYNEHISINRINSLGERVWGDSGVVLASTGTSLSIIRTSDGSYYIQINTNLLRIRQNGEIARQDSVTLGYPVPDQKGGVILSGGVWTGMIPKLVAQRKDSLGNNLWQEPYVEIADSLDINAHLNVKYNSGLIYYSWTGQKNGINKVAQFQALRLDGTKLFSDGTIQIGEPPLGGAYVVPLEKNKTAFIYQETNYLPDSLLTQSYDTLGNKLWDSNGVLISHPSIEYQSFTTDGSSGFIIGGVIDNFTVVSQQVSKDGNLGQVIIPVELTSFSASIISNKIELNWKTATETNNQGFQIERQEAQDERGEEWNSVGFVNGNGTTTESNSYSFVDNLTLDHNHTLYYRLKQIDFDGTFEYSNTIEVNFELPKKFTLGQNYPNPFNSTTIINYEIPQVGRVRISLYNILGEKILTLFEGERSAGTYTINFSSDEVPSGIYFYCLETNSPRDVKKLTILK